MNTTWMEGSPSVLWTSLLASMDHLPPSTLQNTMKSHLVLYPATKVGKSLSAMSRCGPLFGFFLLRPCPFLVELPRVRRPNSRRCKTGTAHIGVVQQRIIQTLMRRPCPAI